MAKFYLIEIVTKKENNETVVSPTATYENEDSNEAARLAEIGYTGQVNYNLQQGNILKDFLVEVFTETGEPVPNMKRFYKFPEPQPESNTDNTEE